jgi:hypothetical protein
MEAHRKLWNQQQKTLRHALTHPDDHRQTIELFLTQHAMVHSAAVVQSEQCSFADAVWQDITDEAARCIPQNGEHSVVWVFWHIARIEDVTMNLLVAGSPQVLYQDNWLERTKATVCHTGNAMSKEDVAQLSATIDIEALRAYRLAAGRRTREVVKQLQPEALKQQVEPARLQKVLDEGAVVEAASGIVTYWSRRSIAGLLLMPPTRHNFIHLNEAARIKQKCLKAVKSGGARGKPAR